MFKSIHYQRILKYFKSPKKFIINLEIKIGNKYTFQDHEVIAMYRVEAIEIAKKQAYESVKVIYKGSKSLGKVKNFNEITH